MYSTNPTHNRPILQGPACTIATSSPCFPNPCQNNGNCTDFNFSYACTCPPGLTGTNCEELLPNIGAAVSTNVPTGPPYVTDIVMATSGTTVSQSGGIVPTTDPTTTCSAHCTAGETNVLNGHVSTRHTSSIGHRRGDSTATRQLGIVADAVPTPTALSQMVLAASTAPNSSNTDGQ